MNADTRSDGIRGEDMDKWKIHKSLLCGRWYVAFPGVFEGWDVYWIHDEFPSGAEAIAAFAAGGR